MLGFVRCQDMIKQLSSVKWEYRSFFWHEILKDFEILGLIHAKVHILGVRITILPQFLIPCIFQCSDLMKDNVSKLNISAALKLCYSFSYTICWIFFELYHLRVQEIKVSLKLPIVALWFPHMPWIVSVCPNWIIFLPKVFSADIISSFHNLDSKCFLIKMGD